MSLLINLKSLRTKTLSFYFIAVFQHIVKIPVHIGAQLIIDDTTQNYNSIHPYSKANVTWHLKTKSLATDVFFLFNSCYKALDSAFFS